MNSNLVSNVAVLSLAVGTMTGAVQQANTGNYASAGILVVIAVLCFLGYEKLPPTPPSA